MKKDDALIKTMKRYKKSGLFKSCTIPIDKHGAFFELFERNKFSYYICDRLKDIQNEKDDKATYPINDNTTHIYNN